MIPVKVHWNLNKAKRGIYEYSVTDKKTGLVTTEFGTNNIRLENAKLHLVKSAYALTQKLGRRKVHAQVYGDLVEFTPLDGRVISCNPIDHATPNFYYVDTMQDIPFNTMGAATFTIQDGKPVCIFKES